MSPSERRGSLWVLVGVIVFVLTITGGYFLLEAPAERLFEDAYAERIEGSARSVATRLRQHAAAVLGQLGEIAARCAGPDGAAGVGCASELDRIRERAPSLVAGTGVFGAGGALLGPEGRHPWSPEELAAVRDACVRPASPGSSEVRLGAATFREGKGLALWAVLPRGSQGGVGAVALSLDLGREAGALVEDASPVAGGAVLVAQEDGGLLAVAAADRWQGVRSLAELLGPEWPLLLARLGPKGTAGEAVRVACSTGFGRVVGAMERVALPGGALIVGELAPVGSLDRGVRTVLLAGAVLVALALAGFVAAFAAWRRAGQVRDAALRESERWRQLAEHQGRDGRWRWLADGSATPMVFLSGSTIVAANRLAAESLADGNPQSFVGRDLLDFAAAEDRERIRQHVLGAGAESAPRRVTAARMVSAGGRRFLGEVTVSPARETAGGQLVAAWEEVGARPAGEATMAAVADAVPHALVLTDPSGNLVWANAAAMRASGELGGLRGRPLLWLIERSHRRGVLAGLARARRGKAAAGELRLAGPGGSAAALPFEALPVRSDDAVVGVLFVVPLVSAQREDGREQPAVARERALSELSASLSHRVRNNVQALLGLLEQLGSCEGAERTLALARSLVADSVEDLRRFFVAASRSDAGPLRPVRLGPVVERWAERARSGVPTNVRVTAKRDTLNDRARADAEQIALWLDVSLSSAVAAMPLGGAVEVTLEVGAQPGWVRLSFADTGQGAAGVELPTERQRFSSRTAARALGELVAARLGGRSGGTSRSGPRNRLWIELPLADEGVAAGDVARGAVRSGPLLLADDEEMVRMSLATALRGAGFDVVEARNGLEVVEKVLAAPARFALVVLDLVMPVMDGREALRRLRECAPALPVVVCTGYDPTGDDVLAAAAVLIKPFTISELLDKVAEFTGRAPSAGENGGNLPA